VELQQRSGGSLLQATPHSLALARIRLSPGIPAIVCDQALSLRNPAIASPMDTRARSGVLGLGVLGSLAAGSRGSRGSGSGSVRSRSRLHAPGSPGPGGTGNSERVPGRAAPFNPCHHSSALRCYCPDSSAFGCLCPDSSALSRLCPDVSAESVSICLFETGSSL
jgi:hypothetical protein